MFFSSPVLPIRRSGFAPLRLPHWAAEVILVCTLLAATGPVWAHDLGNLPATAPVWAHDLGNLPPTARISPSASVTIAAGQTLVFDGSASSDNDEGGNHITQYSWFATGASPTSGGSSTFSVSFANVGTETVYLTVRDDEGSTHQTSVVVTVTLPAPASAPVVVGPTGSTMVSSLTPTLSWNTITHATDYEVDVAFEQNTVWTATSSGTSISVPAGNLSYTTTYGWRIRATNSTGNGPWSAWQFFTTPPPIPATPTGLNPVDYAPLQPLQPLFSWTPSTGATSYTIEVSDVSQVIETGTPAFDSYSLQTTLTYNTQYWWRVRAHNAGGSSGWTAWHRFFTIPAPPSQVALSSPTPYQTNIANQPVLTWSAANNATDYDVVLMDASNQTIESATTTATTYTAQATLAYNTLYKWKVQASNAGGTGPWSQTWSFTVYANTTPTAAISVTPALGGGQTHYAIGSSGLALTLDGTGSSDADPFGGIASYAWSDPDNYPIGSSNTQSITLSGTGNPGSFATFTYSLQVTDNEGSTASTSVDLPVHYQLPPLSNSGLGVALTNGRAALQPVFSWTNPTHQGADWLQVVVAPQGGTCSAPSQSSGQLQPTATTHTLGTTLAYDTTYLWCLNAANTWGTTVVAGGTFTTEAQPPPLAPELSSPVHGATVATNPLLDWATDVGVTGHTVQVAANSSFTNPTIDATTGTSSSYTASGLAYGTTYYWRVQATRNGLTSNWSSVRNFTTSTVTGTPTSPCGTTNESLTPTLAWSLPAGSNPSNVAVAVATNSSFTNTVYSTTLGGSATTHTVPTGSLTNSTTYYWRVTLHFPNASQASASCSFTTEAGLPDPPPAPVLASPSNSGTISTTSPTLIWNAAAGASMYQVQVSRSSVFSTLLVDQSGVTSTSHPLSGLGYGTRYYWRVKATNSGGSSAWSTAWSFVTPTVQATLTAPSNGATDLSLTPTLSWSVPSGSNVTDVRVELSTSSTFGSLAHSANLGASATSYPVPNGVLSHSTTYYWRVQLSFPDVASLTSGRSFTTYTPTPNLVVTPSSVPQTTVLEGQTGYQYVNIANTGDAMLTYAVAAPPSWLTATPGGTSIGVGGSSQTLTLTYQAGSLSPGTYPGSVTITSNDADTPTTVLILSMVVQATAPPLEAPVLQAPSAGATQVSTLPTFTWNSATSATSYRVQVDTDNTFQAPLIVDHAGLTGLSYSLGTPLAYHTTYYWRVIASDGSTTEAAAARSFTTRLAPPTNLTPATANTATDVALCWDNPTDPAITRFLVHIDGATGGDPTVNRAAGAQTCYQPPSDFALSTTYTWNVQSLDATTGYSDATAAAFTTTDFAFTTPTATTSWLPNQAVTVAWVQTYSEAVSLDLYDAAGTYLSTLTSSTTAGTSGNGTYGWNAPLTSGTYRLRIASVSQPSRFAFSPLFTVEMVNDIWTFALEPEVSALAFGNVSVGYPAYQLLTIRNTGGHTTTDDLTVTLSLSGNTDVFAVEHTSVPSSALGTHHLQGNQALTLAIRFQPLQTTASTATLTIQHNDTDASGLRTSPVTVALSGTGQTALDDQRLSLTPATTTYALGTVPLGYTAEEAIVLANTGSAPLTGTLALSSSDPNASDWSLVVDGQTVTSPYAYILQPNAQHQLHVRLTPTSDGTRTATLTLTHDDQDQPSPHTLSFTAEAEATLDQVHLQRTPATNTLRYGILHTNADSAQTLTLANLGTQSLSFTLDLTSGTPFHIAHLGADLAVPSSYTLNPGASHTFEVHFRPLTPGEATATLSIQHNDLDLPDPLTINLWGVAVQPTPKKYYYLKDHLGSIRVTVNEQGGIVHHDDYYAFGVRLPGRSMETPESSRERYTGHELDEETGLYYAGARYLDPVIGRWMATDPLADSYPGWSPYNYGLNNPLFWVDPNGKNVYCITKGENDQYSIGVQDAEGEHVFYYRESADQECKESRQLDMDNTEDANLVGRLAYRSSAFFNHLMEHSSSAIHNEFLGALGGAMVRVGQAEFRDHPLMQAIEMLAFGAPQIFNPRNPAVIGREMTRWVLPQAEKLKAMYMNLPDILRWSTNPSSMERMTKSVAGFIYNLAWIVGKKYRGRTIIDVGTRPGTVLSPSPFYTMEQVINAIPGGTLSPLVIPYYLLDM